MMPAITVLTASFNRSEELLTAVRSVQKQSFSDWEYWILDDGSSDQTFQKVKPFLRDKRIHFFRQKHRGQYPALNRALKKVHSPLVTFLDSDDYYLPGHLQGIVRAFKENPELDFVLSGFRLKFSDPRKKWTVHDFFNPGKKIPVSEIEFGSGFLAAKTAKIKEAGCFPQRRFPDVSLIQNMLQSGFCWKRLKPKTYVYWFDRSK